MLGIVHSISDFAAAVVVVVVVEYAVAVVAGVGVVAAVEPFLESQLRTWMGIP